MQNGKIEIELGRDQDDPLIFGGRKNADRCSHRLGQQMDSQIWILIVESLEFMAFPQYFLIQRVQLSRSA